MNWLQWTSFAFLVGAEMNAEFSRGIWNSVRSEGENPKVTHDPETGSRAA